MNPWTIIGLVVLILLFLVFFGNIVHYEYHQDGSGRSDGYGHGLTKRFYYFHPLNLILCIICAVGIYYVVKDLF